MLGTSGMRAAPVTRFSFALTNQEHNMKPFFAPIILALFSAYPSLTQSQEPGAKIIRAGMIGLDTSHVPAFARLFNKPDATGDVAGIKVVAGYPGGTDIP